MGLIRVLGHFCILTFCVLGSGLWAALCEPYVLDPQYSVLSAQCLAPETSHPSSAPDVLNLNTGLGAISWSNPLLFIRFRVFRCDKFHLTRST